MLYKGKRDQSSEKIRPTTATNKPSGIIDLIKKLNSNQIKQTIIPESQKVPRPRSNSMPREEESKPKTAVSKPPIFKKPSLTG